MTLVSSNFIMYVVSWVNSSTRTYFKRSNRHSEHPNRTFELGFFATFWTQRKKNGWRNPVCICEMDVGDAKSQKNPAWPSFIQQRNCSVMPRQFQTSSAIKTVKYLHTAAWIKSQHFGAQCEHIAENVVIGILFLTMRVLFVDETFLCNSYYIYIFDTL